MLCVVGQVGLCSCNIMVAVVDGTAFNVIKEGIFIMSAVSVSCLQEPECFRIKGIDFRKERTSCKELHA